MHLPPGICRDTGFYSLYIYKFLLPNRFTAICGLEFTFGFRYMGSLVRSGSGEFWVLRFSRTDGYETLSGPMGGWWLFYVNVLRQGVSFTLLVVDSPASVSAFGNTECRRCELEVQNVAPLRVLTFWS